MQWRPFMDPRRLHEEPFRPENVLVGHLTWPDYRPSDRPNTVRIEHHKTGEMVPLPLSDRDG
jgi:hypothetical protein